MNKIKKIINKKNKSKIVCLTAYSKNFSEEIDKYVDIVLVGDSLGSVLYNYSTTRKVTLTEMINHSKSVKLGIKKSLMVVDMPYKTYNTKKLALKNALRYFDEKFHKQLIVEFKNELDEFGRIYMYRFRPDYDIYARPIKDYPHKSKEAACLCFLW